MKGLKRDISTTAILVASAGGMVGSGWLFTSYYSAKIAGSGALISWLIATIFMIFIALPLCELGAMYPVSGGLSNYPKFTHGKIVGFIFSWLMWLSYLVMIPIEVQAVLQYSSIYWPNLLNADQSLTLSGYFCALFIMVFLVILNNFGIKLIAEVNKYISIWKFIIPVLAALAFIFVTKNPTLPSFHFASVDSWNDIFSALAIGGIAFAFTGFQNGLVLAGEVKNPQRNIPISILGAILVGFVLYTLLQYSFLVGVPKSMLDAQGGFSNLSFQGDAGPLVGLALVLGLGIIAKLLLLDAVVSPLGTAVIYTTATSRILYGMAENGFLPKTLLKLNRHHIPYITIIVNFFFGMLTFLPFPGWQKMVAFLSSTSILTYGIGGICLLAFRKQKPDMARPFKMPFPYIISNISFFVCSLMLYWCGWDNIWKLCIAVFIGLSFSLIFYKSTRTMKAFNELGWFLFYLVAILIISYFGNFGGNNLLISPYDYVCLFTLSLFTLRWSTYTATKYNQQNSDELPLEKKLERA
jgi:amino acid transporter